MAMVETRWTKIDTRRYSIVEDSDTVGEVDGKETRSTVTSVIRDTRGEVGRRSQRCQGTEIGVGQRDSARCHVHRGQVWTRDGSWAVFPLPLTLFVASESSTWKVIWSFLIPYIRDQFDSLFLPSVVPGFQYFLLSSGICLGSTAFSFVGACRALNPHRLSFFSFFPCI
ncbi:hypothetical protein HD554DRAFT_1577963 [Boletus coccyginus]|nr:hypothetical protein HD554DRAFT_1577963 [Boletus coccyginus]